MSSGDWYKVLVENNLTMVSAKDRTLKPCKAELLNPAVNWEQTWSLACLGGLSSDDKTFLWKMLHNILPTQERLHRMGMKNAPSPNCTFCSSNEVENLAHAFITCPLNKQVSDWLLPALEPHVLGFLPHQLVHLNLKLIDEDSKLPVVWVVAQVLGKIWMMRKEKKKPQLFQIRATLEAGIEILRKTRFKEACKMLELILKS